MCGISGYFGRGNTQLLKAMNDALVHRGPDGHGVWEDTDVGVGFAHRRLSIVDLSDSGAQPMRSTDGLDASPCVTTANSTISLSIESSWKNLATNSRATVIPKYC